MKKNNKRRVKLNSVAGGGMFDTFKAGVTKYGTMALNTDVAKNVGSQLMNSGTKIVSAAVNRGVNEVVSGVNYVTNKALSGMGVDPNDME